ncbi:MAG: Nramp family divalent metal transporter [Bacteroidales bacterium]|nr:Nramp family divalent metal transporter [Bacteroidales bacterium]
MGKRFKGFGSIGPATLVAAAFIGPGTVTTCSIAGADYGYTLLWALLFSVIATLILQEMAARLGVAGQTGLGEALRREFARPFARITTIILVLSAIAIGNAAYETGNIMGGVMGLMVITGRGLVTAGAISVNFWAPVIGLIAFMLLWFGSYRTIERGLITLVILMSLTFIGTALMVKPDPLAIASGMVIPKLPAGGIMTVAGLIGTTVVPYNLFLHASASRERWKSVEGLRAARTDSIVSISLGGLISAAIVITSAAAFHGRGLTITGAADMAMQLEPLLGAYAPYFLAAGFLAAGLSSAITAPLAAAWATSGILGWKGGIRDKRFRMVWMAVLLTGVVFSMTGTRPVAAIFFAQVTNGILLPLIAIFLLKVMNSREILGNHRNRLPANIAGAAVVLVASFLGIKSIISIFNMI